MQIDTLYKSMPFYKREIFNQNYRDYYIFSSSEELDGDSNSSFLKYGKLYKYGKLKNPVSKSSIKVTNIPALSFISNNEQFHVNSIEIQNIPLSIFNKDFNKLLNMNLSVNLYSEYTIDEFMRLFNCIISIYRIDSKNVDDSVSRYINLKKKIEKIDTKYKVFVNIDSSLTATITFYQIYKNDNDDLRNCYYCMDILHNSKLSSDDLFIYYSTIWDNYYYKSIQVNDPNTEYKIQVPSSRSININMQDVKKEPYLDYTKYTVETKGILNTNEDIRIEEEFLMNATTNDSFIVIFPKFDSNDMYNYNRYEVNNDDKCINLYLLSDIVSYNLIHIYSSQYNASTENIIDTINCAYETYSDWNSSPEKYFPVYPKSDDFSTVSDNQTIDNKFLFFNKFVKQFLESQCSTVTEEMDHLDLIVSKYEYYDSNDVIMEDNISPSNSKIYYAKMVSGNLVYVKKPNDAKEACILFKYPRRHFSYMIFNNGLLVNPYKYEIGSHTITAYIPYKNSDSKIEWFEKMLKFTDNGYVYIYIPLSDFVTTLPEYGVTPIKFNKGNLYTVTIESPFNENPTYRLNKYIFYVLVENADVSGTTITINEEVFNLVSENDAPQTYNKITVNGNDAYVINKSGSGEYYAVISNKSFVLPFNKRLSNLNTNIINIKDNTETPESDKIVYNGKIYMEVDPFYGVYTYGAKISNNTVTEFKLIRKKPLSISNDTITIDNVRYTKVTDASYGFTYVRMSSKPEFFDKFASYVSLILDIDTVKNVVFEKYEPIAKYDEEPKPITDIDDVFDEYKVTVPDGIEGDLYSERTDNAYSGYQGFDENNEFLAYKFPYQIESYGTKILGFLDGLLVNEFIIRRKITNRLFDGDMVGAFSKQDGENASSVYVATLPSYKLLANENTVKMHEEDGSINYTGYTIRLNFDKDIYSENIISKNPQSNDFRINFFSKKYMLVFINGKFIPPDNIVEIDNYTFALSNIDNILKDDFDDKSQSYIIRKLNIYEYDKFNYDKLSDFYIQGGDEYPISFDDIYSVYGIIKTERALKDKYSDDQIDVKSEMLADYYEKNPTKNILGVKLNKVTISPSISPDDPDIDKDALYEIFGKFVLNSEDIDGDLLLSDEIEQYFSILYDQDKRMSLFYNKENGSRKYEY